METSGHRGGGEKEMPERKEEGEKIFHIHELRRYGEPDSDKVVKITAESFNNLPTITTEQLDQYPIDDPYGEGKAESMVFPTPWGTVVFIKNYDTETHSATYRSGAYSISGPYRLVVEDNPSKK